MDSEIIKRRIKFVNNEIADLNIRINELKKEKEEAEEILKKLEAGQKNLGVPA